MLKSSTFGEVFLLVYVDDILVLEDRDEGIEYTVGSLKSLYEVRRCVGERGLVLGRAN